MFISNATPFLDPLAKTRLNPFETKLGTLRVKFQTFYRHIAGYFPKRHMQQYHYINNIYKHEEHIL